MENKYFQHLNYTLGNEDTTFEATLLPKETKVIYTIAGSGSRVAPLALHNVEEIVYIDLSESQLLLTELRLESIKQLSHSDYCSLFGFTKTTLEKRKTIFESLQLNLENKEKMRLMFESFKWDSILFSGRWEKTMLKLAKILDLFISKKTIQKMFSFQKEEDYFKFLDHSFPWRRFNFVLRIAGNSALFNALLYKGEFPKKNLKESFYEFYKNRFHHLLYQSLPQKNWFLQLIFLKDLPYLEGHPIETNPQHFESMKSTLQKCKCTAFKGNLFELCEKKEFLNKCDFFSISDVPSYFSGDVETNFLQMLKPLLNQNALIVERSYLHIPENIKLDGFEEMTEQFQSLIQSEKVGVYNPHIYKKL